MSRRSFLVRLIVYTAMLLMPVGSFYRIQANNNKSGGKFIKQGWLLQEGDV
jgi:hypothetical protein